MKSSRIDELKKRIAEQQQASNSAKDKSPTKQAQQEIAAARTQKTEAVVPAATEKQSTDAAETSTQEEAERRRRNKERNEALLAKLSQRDAERAAKSTALQQDAKLFQGFKEEFKNRRDNIIKWHEGMHKQTRQGLIKLLNIGEFIAEANEQNGEIVSADTPAAKTAKSSQVVGMMVPGESMAGENAQMMQEVPAYQSSKAMQMVPVSQMFVAAPSQSVENAANPAKTATFAEVLNFNYLFKAALAVLPADAVITGQSILEKLDAFMLQALAFNAEKLKSFETQQKRYDQLCVRLRDASPRDKGGIYAEFVGFRKEFFRSYQDVVEALMTTVAHLSDLMAYLENNLKADMDVREALEAEYQRVRKAGGAVENIQMKKMLVERCAPSLCLALGNNTDKSGILECINSIVLNDALANNNQAVIAVYYGM